jgi:hypothetical protein
MKVSAAYITRKAPRRTHAGGAVTGEEDAATGIVVAVVVTP